MQGKNLKISSSHYNSIFKPIREDIVDRNGEPIAKNIRVYHAAIKPNFIKDKKKFILKLKLLDSKIDTKIVKKNLEKISTFYLKKNITEEERLNLWSLEKKVCYLKKHKQEYIHTKTYLAMF